ncbi:hypothetical protein Trydic_g2718 [Trypoxylus dichotomus]
MSKKAVVVCRTCLHQSQSYIAIFEHYECNKLLSEMLTECTAVKVEQQNDLPVHMCNDCVQKLIVSWNFKLMAIDSDQKLRSNDKYRSPMVFPIEDDDNIEDSIYEDIMSIKEEDIVIKLEDSDLPPANKENCDNKLNYVECERAFVESEKCDDPTSRIEVAATEDEIQPNSSEKTEDIFEKESGNMNEREIDEQPFDSIFEYDENGVPRTKNGRKLTWREREKVPMFCKPCNRFFLYKYYRIHRRQHTGETPYKCDTCKKVFALMHQLKSHQRIHSDEYQYACDICEKRFKYNDNLLLHKRTHTEEKPFKCDICSLMFKQAKYLKAHMQRHVKEKLYVCETCGKSFCDPSAFSNHKRCHMENKLHPCPICGKKFATLPRLKGHEKQVHSDNRPFACSHCDKRFKVKDTLRKHTLIHTGEKPYVCNICGKRFRQRECLPPHIRMHTGETPYCCEKCPAKFKHPHLLKKHVKVHND